jgi:hypothetical protein
MIMLEIIHMKGHELLEDLEPLIMGDNLRIIENLIDFLMMQELQHQEVDSLTIS